MNPNYFVTTYKNEIRYRKVKIVKNCGQFRLQEGGKREGPHWWDPS